MEIVRVKRGDTVVKLAVFGDLRFSMRVGYALAKEGVVSEADVVRFFEERRPVPAALGKSSIGEVVMLMTAGKIKISTESYWYWRGVARIR